MSRADDAYAEPIPLAARRGRARTPDGDATPTGLPRALRALARAVEADSGVTIAVVVRGHPVPLGPGDALLYRVGREALVQAWQHARCSLVSISLEYAGAAATLRVRDDGVGLAHRDPAYRLDIGTTSTRRAVAAAGGTLRMRDVEPRGVLVEARLGRY